MLPILLQPRIQAMAGKQDRWEIGKVARFSQENRLRVSATRSSRSRRFHSRRRWRTSRRRSCKWTRTINQVSLTRERKKCWVMSRKKGKRSRQLVKQNHSSHKRSWSLANALSWTSCGVGLNQVCDLRSTTRRLVRFLLAIAMKIRQTTNIQYLSSQRNIQVSLASWRWPLNKCAALLMTLELTDISNNAQVIRHFLSACTWGERSKGMPSTRLWNSYLVLRVALLEIDASEIEIGMPWAYCRRLSHLPT